MDLLAASDSGIDSSDAQLEILALNSSGSDDNSDGFIVTKQGFNLLGKALAGKELKFVRVAFGDSMVNGEISSVSDNDAYNLTNLIHWRKDLPLVDIVNLGTGEVNLHFLVANSDVTEGFWMCETGVFALDPDTGNEILYCYRNAGLRGGWLPPSSGAEIWEQVMIITLAIGQSPNVTALVDRTLLYVSQEQFLNHIDSDDPHPHLLNLSKKEFLNAVF